MRTAKAWWKELEKDERALIIMMNKKFGIGKKWFAA
jgi:hypothetical protein